METFVQLGLEPVNETSGSGENFDEMIADYMDKGFLDNIIALLKYNGHEHVGLVSKLVSDERLRVRIGAIALVESMKEIGLGINDAVSDTLVPLLRNSSPTVRGDALYCLGLIGRDRHLPEIKLLLEDENAEVADSARDAIGEIAVKD